MKLSWVTRALHPRHVFRISRARRREVRNVFVCIEHDGIRGYGEASPNAFYDETCEQVEERLNAARDRLATLQISSPADIEAAWLEGWRWFSPSRAAQCAVDVALWDWLARREDRSVSELAWGQPPHELPTFCTIGLSTAEELEEKLTELDGFPRIKIKAGRDARIDTIRRAHARSEAWLAVDANCAWTPADLERLGPELATLGVRFIEQPLPPGEESSLPRARSRPIFADESCVTETDVDRVAESFDGFNIKLVKCGGITPARRMALRGEELGRLTMVGCMLESSVLIAAGAAIAQRATFTDLDGAWLLADDPFRGWRFDRGVLVPPEVAGLGVEPIGDLDFR